MSKNNEMIIANLFKEKFPIEWMRYKMYFSEDIYRSIPYLLYRYKNGYDQIYQKELLKYVEKFEGKQKWTTFHPYYIKNKNYILTLKVVYEKMEECKREGRLYNEKKEFGNKLNRLCEEAIDDIPDLEKYLKIYMGGRGSRI